MLQFLKQHQRKIFIAITAMTIASFVFFGTFSTFVDAPQTVPDREVVKGVNGKPLMKRQLDALCALLSTSSFVVGGRGLPNLLNDGVIERQLLSSADVLAAHYFPLFKEELEERFKKVRQFRPYAHPQVPLISAQNVWQRFAPQLFHRLNALKKHEEVTPEVLTAMIQLYIEQANCPPELLKRILFFQMQQQGLPLDPQLAQSDLSLFGFTSLEEWFGPRFVQLHAQFIANAALLAEEKGYAISKEEVRMELFQNLYAGAKRLSQEDAPLTAQEVQNYFYRKMHEWGLEEKEMLEAWRKVMLFCRLFDDVGGTMLLDTLAYRQFQEYSEQCVTVELYELPTALQLADFETMLKLQVYLEIVAPQLAQTDLSLPTAIDTPENVEKRAASLVERQYELSVAEVKRSALANEISLRKTWEWEAEEAHWPLLCKQCSQLKGESREERLAALDALDAKTRLELDQFARAQMVDRGQLIEALDHAEERTETVSLRKQGGRLPFSEGISRQTLHTLLEGATLDTPIDCATDDGEIFYRIRVRKKEPMKRILTFAQAQSDATLDALLKKRLEEAYVEMRKKNPAPYQRDLVGRFLYRPLLKAIEEGYKTAFGPLPGTAGELPLNFYSNYRLFFHMQKAKENLAYWVKNREEDPILEQWRLQKTQRQVRRSDTLSIPKEEMFTLKPQDWSPVNWGSGGALAFYQLIEENSAVEKDAELIKQGHTLLARDAQRELILEWIALIDRTKAVNVNEL